MDDSTTTSMTPVQQSNQSAALPGSSSSAAPSATGAPAPASTAASSTPYATQTTPVNTSGLWPVNAQGQAPGPRTIPESRTKDDVVVTSDESVETVEQPTVNAPPKYVAPVTGIIARGPGNVFTADRGRGRRNHSGVDMTAPNGTPVVAAIGGTVRYVGNNSGYGMNAVIVGDDGNVFRYATHATVSVKPGDRVEQGQEIGTIGAGHLHFEVIKGDSPLYGPLSTSTQFVPTSWMRGRPNPGVTDPLEVLGVSGGLRVSAGQALGEMRGLAQELTINPRLRETVVTAPAFGAQGARSAPDPLNTTSLAAAVQGGQLLQRGSRGAAVEELQGFLNARGITDTNGQTLVVDGIFGRATRSALKRYQDLSAIEVDGVAGPETLRAILYDVDPLAGPESDGSAAYVDGANAAQKIIDPTAPEVAIPLPRMRPDGREVDIALPRQRPERGAGVPDPRMNPRRTVAASGPAQWSDVDEMTMVDENGNYINQPAPPPNRKDQPPRFPEGIFGPAELGRLRSDYRDSLVAEGFSESEISTRLSVFETALRRTGQMRYASGMSAADIGREVSDYRQKLQAEGFPEFLIDQSVNVMEERLKSRVVTAQRVSDASAAARGATRQRFSGLSPATDRFRPRGNDRSAAVERVRVTEAVREFARGISDTYSRVVARNAVAPLGAMPSISEQRQITNAAFRLTPSPAETVTETYAFRAA